MAVEQASPPTTLDGLTRDQWIAARMADFAADPQTRDRALAVIAHDVAFSAKQIAELTGMVREKGIGGVFKMLMSGGR